MECLHYELQMNACILRTVCINWIKLEGIRPTQFDRNHS